MRAIKLQFLTAALVLFPLASTLSAQKAKAPTSLPPPAPVPEQISAARKIFIGNTGTLGSGVADTVFSGGPDRPYNEFYNAMKSFGRYELVSAPANADLVLEINLEFPSGVFCEFRLQIIDPQTHVTLWNLTEYVQGAALLSNRDKNFDQAMNTIVSRFQQLAGPPTQAQARD